MADKTPKIDYKFFTGFFLVIFLVFMHSFYKEIPIHIVAIPAFLMGFDLADLAKIIRRK